MADFGPSYKAIDDRRKTFYICTCPPQPVSRRGRDVIEWYMHHINTCKPRKIEDLHLPEYEGV
jgi:hypothetical protein